MDLLVTLGRTLGFSFAAGVNLYATVAVIGLASRFEWVTLPPQFQIFDSDVVIGVHMVGGDAGEIIQLAGIAVKAKLTKAQWDATCAVHPTAAEELVTLKDKRA